MEEGRKVCIDAHHKVRRINHLCTVIIFRSTGTNQVSKSCRDDYKRILFTLNETVGSFVRMMKLERAIIGSRTIKDEMLNEKTNSARLKRECILLEAVTSRPIRCKGQIEEGK